MNIGTRLFTMLRGREVGRDGSGNIYYEDRKERPGQARRRWVAYAGAPEATKVPAEWHAWLHYTIDAPIEAAKRPWQQPHVPNQTGTAARYTPPGATGQRNKATGDYEAWTPGT